MRHHVRANDKKAVYRLIVASAADVNAVLSRAPSGALSTHSRSMLLQEHLDPPLDDGEEGFSLLHLACQTADLGMAELLLQYGANVNAPDPKGQTPLHHCVLEGKNDLAKLFLSR